MTDTSPHGGSEARAARARELRHRLADTLVAQGAIQSEGVEAAFRTVPRHRFAPEVSLETAYANDVVLVKRNRQGIATSSISQPSIQAIMLEQAGIRPGMRVLEIGSNGPNAAMIAELVGPEGETTTLDIDPYVTDRARRFLSDTGYGRVHVVLADGEEACAEHAPYDRVIVTVGAWDIPPAWREQLTADGGLVVPLRMRGLTRSVAFAREGDLLVSRSAVVCGFVAIQGIGEHTERLELLRGGEIALRFDEDQEADAGLLTDALDTARAEAWTSVVVARTEPFDDLMLWLAASLPGWCLLSLDRALDSGVVAPANQQACPAVVSRDSLAYLALRRARAHTLPGGWELGAHGYGPEAEALAGLMADQIRVWHRQHRAGPEPRIVAHPAHTPDERLPEGGFVLDKRHVRLALSWT